MSLFCSPHFVVPRVLVVNNRDLYCLPYTLNYLLLTAMGLTFTTCPKSIALVAFPWPTGAVMVVDLF